MKILLLLMLGPFAGFGQKLKEKRYDRFDSLQKIITSNEVLYGKILGKDYLATNCTWMKFMNVKGEPTVTTLMVAFKTNSVTSLSENTSDIKIEFIDNSISTYPYTGDYHLLPSENYGIFSLNINAGDPLFSKNIKTVRVKTDNQIYEYAIKEKVSDLVKNSLAIITDEVKKGF